MLRLTQLVNSSCGISIASALGTARFASAVPKRVLKEIDPKVHDLIECEKHRQWRGLEMIASENFASEAVLEALGCCMNNKYSEGYPGARYYGGNEFVDISETLCQDRALEVFGLDPEQWGVNVQPLSGSPANFAAYTALLKPHDRMMGLDLPHGGHLTHGFANPKKRVSCTAVYFESMPYRLGDDGRIDYDMLEKNALLFRPKVIIAGGSAYPRQVDYARMREIADSVGAYVMSDMAHTSGLMAAGVIPGPLATCTRTFRLLLTPRYRSRPGPFEHSDVVTTTTHKTLRGPRGGMIFYRKGVRSVDKKGKKTMYVLEDAVNQAVFPSFQGGPHQHQIAAISVALKEAMEPEYKEYQQRVLDNAARLAKNLKDKGYKLTTDGTDTHLMLWDLRPQKITGSKYEKLLDAVHITLNKNSVVGDLSAMNPGGVRIGTPAVTSRGMAPKDMDTIADFFERGLKIALDIQAKAPSKKLTDFVKGITTHPEVPALRKDVLDFATQFDIPGFDITKMKYQDKYQELLEH